MVNGCINPECGKEFRLLGGGDLYACERANAATEFFWLCAECARRLELSLNREGSVQVLERGGLGRKSPQHLAGHLRIVASAALRMPWRHSVPAAEQHSCWMGERREGSWRMRRAVG